MIERSKQAKGYKNNNKQHFKNNKNIEQHICLIGFD
jgi:hypothetical protein